MEKKHLKAITQKQDGRLLAIASTEDVDRSGDSILVKDWDFGNFNRNPVLQAGHDYRPQYTIGIAKDLHVEGDKVIFEPIFHTITPLAKQIKEMYEKGFLKAWSVGFIPAQSKGGRHELLEVSAVAVPANANALMKSMASIEEKQVEEIAEQFEVWKKSLMDDGEPEPEDFEEAVEDTPFVEDEADEIEDGVEVKSVKEDAPKDVPTELWNTQLPEVFKKGFVKEEGNVSHRDQLYKDYLGVSIRKVFSNCIDVSMPMLGNYLTALDEVTKNFKQKEVFNMDWDGRETAPEYAEIQLKSDRSETFLIVGTRLCEVDGVPVIIEVRPTWDSFMVKFVTSIDAREKNEGFASKMHTWVQENNLLKGEKFALSGKFLGNQGATLDELLLNKGMSEKLEASISPLKKGEDMKSRGLLFIGPPGTGKTMTGRAIKDSSEATFIWISSADMVRVGALGAMKMAFSMANQLTPTVLFFEDIDTWVGNSAIDLLKTELDGLRKNKGVLTILTTNNPENLPDSLIDRPGRFHEILSFDLPDEETRKGMILTWADGVLLDVADTIAKDTEGYSGAHVKELVEYAGMLREDNEMSISDSLVKSYKKLAEQREIVQHIRQTTKGFEGAELKVGRVISKKNRKVLSDATDALTKAMGALNEVLAIEESTPEEVVKEDKVETSKEVEPAIQKEAKAKLTERDIAFKTLQTIAKITNEGIRQKRRECIE